MGDFHRKMPDNSLAIADLAQFLLEYKQGASYEGLKTSQCTFQEAYGFLKWLGGL
jgi:hypothetical protein